MKKIKYLFLITLSILAFNSCADDNVDFTENLNFITFESTSANFPVPIDGTLERVIKVYTTNKTGSDRVFNVSVDIDATTADPASYTVPTTVTIPANTNVGDLPVSVSDMNIGVAGKKLVLQFNEEANLYEGADITLNVAQSCPGNEANLKITFDGYGSETTWRIVDSSNKVVVSGGPYKDGDINTFKSFCLGKGSYTFYIYDSYGDGLTYPNLGNISLTKNGNVLFDLPGDFGEEGIAPFTIQ
jgi:hypothetical protein